MTTNIFSYHGYSNEYTPRNDYNAHVTMTTEKLWFDSFHAIHFNLVLHARWLIFSVCRKSILQHFYYLPCSQFQICKKILVADSVCVFDIIPEFLSAPIYEWKHIKECFQSIWNKVHQSNSTEISFNSFNAPFQSQYELRWLIFPPRIFESMSYCDVSLEYYMIQAWRLFYIWCNKGSETPVVEPFVEQNIIRKRWCCDVSLEIYLHRAWRLFYPWRKWGSATDPIYIKYRTGPVQKGDIVTYIWNITK